MTDGIKEESRSHDCPIGGISLRVLSQAEAEGEDKVTEQSKVEQKLVEKIAKELFQYYHFIGDNKIDYRWDDLKGKERENWFRCATLAKEAGYKSPEEVVVLQTELRRYFEERIKEAKVEARKGYVQLADDQSLPESVGRVAYERLFAVMEDRKIDIFLLDRVVGETQMDMLKDCWRKIKGG